VRAVRAVALWPIEWLRDHFHSLPSWNTPLTWQGAWRPPPRRRGARRGCAGRHTREGARRDSSSSPRACGRADPREDVSALGACCARCLPEMAVRATAFTKPLSAGRRLSHIRRCSSRSSKARAPVPRAAGAGRFQGERRVRPLVSWRGGRIQAVADAQVNQSYPGKSKTARRPDEECHCAAARFSPRPLTLSSIGF